MAITSGQRRAAVLTAALAMLAPASSFALSAQLRAATPRVAARSRGAGVATTTRMAIFDPPEKLTDRGLNGQSIFIPPGARAGDKKGGFVEDFGEGANALVEGGASSVVSMMDDPSKKFPVQAALKKVENDMLTLDDVVASTSQLSPTEFGILSATVITALTSPFFFATKVTEVLVPSAAALAAAVGISAEYVGKTSVANGKEIAAVTLMAAAEAEAGLAAGERAKAIIPLAVGIGATSTAFALLAPALLEDVALRYGVSLVTELYLIPPLLSVLSAAVAGLAAQETASLCRAAASVGNRRFARANDVGNSWLSASEQVDASSSRYNKKWIDFAITTLPAPILAAAIPGPLAFKAIVASASAAAQSAYYLTAAEYEISRTMDSVALKTRSAAIADAYANQGTRSGAILPFTSALAALCAASTAAVVEFLPLLPSIEIEAVVGSIFPAFGALFASAASVAKSRCETNAAAASAAADSFSKDAERDKESDRGLEPVNGVVRLIKITSRSIFKTFRGVLNKLEDKPLFGWLKVFRRGGGSTGTPAMA